MIDINTNRKQNIIFLFRITFRQKANSFLGKDSFVNFYGIENALLLPFVFEFS